MPQHEQICAEVDLKHIQSLIDAGLIRPYVGNGSVCKVTLYITPLQHERVVNHGSFEVTETHTITAKGAPDQQNKNKAAHEIGSEKTACLGTAWVSGRAKDTQLPY